jgi:hypothetical protein
MNDASGSSSGSSSGSNPVVDWRDVADDVRQWIELTKDAKSHARWANLVRKKSVEHWRKQMAGDAAYQAAIKASEPSQELQELAVETPATEADCTMTTNVPEQSKRTRGKRKMPAAPTNDSFRAVKARQDKRDGVASSAPESAASQAARASAMARASMHGKRAAAEAGEAASAHVQTSERLADGLGSLRVNVSARETAPVPHRRVTPTTFSERQLALYEKALERAGMESLDANPLDLHNGMDVRDIRRAIQQSNPATRVTFGSISSAAASSSSAGVPCFRSISTDSLSAHDTAPDGVDHFGALQRGFAAR